MANIKINTLYSNGSELFNDSESFLNALSDAEVGMQGGIYSDCMTLTTMTIPTIRTTTLTSTIW